MHITIAYTRTAKAPLILRYAFAAGGAKRYLNKATILRAASRGASFLSATVKGGDEIALVGSRHQLSVICKTLGVIPRQFDIAAFAYPTIDQLTIAHNYG